MSISVGAFLRLPLMEGAVLLTGVKSCDRLIRKVGIIDYYDPDFDYDKLFHSTEYLKGEIMLTARFSLFPPDLQCSCIRFLCRTQAVGLLLFQAYEEKPAPEAVALAEELSLPLVQLPASQNSYNELIVAITGITLQENQNEYFLPSTLFYRLAQLPEHQRTIEALLSVLSEHCRYAIAVYDKHWNLLHTPSWRKEDVALFQEPDFLEHLPPGPGLQYSFTTEKGRSHYAMFYTVSLSEDYLECYLAVLAEDGEISDVLCKHIIEAIRLFFHIWGRKYQSTNTLSQAILHRETVKAGKLAGQLGIRLDHFRTMFVCLPQRELPIEQLLMQALAVERYFSENGLRYVVGTCDGCVAAFFEDPSYPLELQAFAEAFCAETGQAPEQWTILAQRDRNIVSKAHDLFGLFLRCAESAKRVYPCKQILSERELIFVQDCMSIVQSGQTAIRCATAVLEPLTSDQNLQNEILFTLSAYLLDAECVPEKTAKIIFVHKSTVKYRVKRANDMLGFEIRKMPEFFHIYQALAVVRLTS